MPSARAASAWRASAPAPRPAACSGRPSNPRPRPAPSASWATASGTGSSHNNSGAQLTPGCVAALADTPGMSCGRRLARRHLDHRTYRTNFRCRTPAGRPAAAALTAAGIGDQPRHQLLVHVDPSQPCRTVDYRAQRLAPQRPQRVHPRREDSQLRVGEQLVEELRAHGSHHLHRAGQRWTQQCGEPSPLGRPSLSEQLLELVDHHQQVRSSRSGPGQQQFVARSANPPSSEPAANVRHPGDRRSWPLLQLAGDPGPPDVRS